MPRSVDSSRGTGGSILSVLTTSSRASEAYQTEAEKSASRITRRTVSDSGHRSDHESGRNTPQPNRDQVKRKREFKGRHIQMFGIGATIGAGVLLGSGKSLYFAGPVSTLLAYLVVATVVYSVLITLGEMISYLPIAGGFASLANRFLSPSIGFGVGWIYFFSKMLDVPNKLVAASNYMKFWTNSVHPAVWITIYVIPPILFNLFNVRKYGEIEFWLTLQKVTTFVLLISYGILMAMQASNVIPWSGTTSTYDPVPCSDSEANIPCVGGPGFNLWREDGFKTLLLGDGWGRLIAFWSVCCQACFSYAGAESVAITASEVERPRQTIPKAVRRIVNRLNFYYIGAIFVLGLNLSSNDPILARSLSDPSVGYHGSFVLMSQRAGIPRFGDFLNVMALGAALSISNASLYITSRVLYALAREGQAPEILLTKNNYDVPWVALIVASLPASLAFMSVKVSSKEVFDFLSGMSTTGTLIAWAAICAMYIRFRKAYQAQGIEIVEESKSSLQPFLAWYGLTWTCFLSIILCISSLKLAIFQGFLCFARNKNYWAIYADAWGFSLGPYAAIGGFVLLVCSWLVRARVKEHKWTWQMRPVERVDLIRGVAPSVDPPPVFPQAWRRVVHAILEYL